MWWASAKRVRVDSQSPVERSLEPWKSQGRAPGNEQDSRSWEVPLPHCEVAHEHCQGTSPLSFSSYC